MKAVILAGGGGSRLWPWSRQNNPKQLKSILGKDTLLKRTYKRLRLKFDNKDILISTRKDHEKEVRKQLPQIPKANIFVRSDARPD